MKDTKIPGNIAYITREQVIETQQKFYNKGCKDTLDSQGFISKQRVLKCKDLIIKYEIGNIEKDKFIDIMKRLLFEY
jgi:hypothetical protein